MCVQCQIGLPCLEVAANESELVESDTKTVKQARRSGNSQASGRKLAAKLYPLDSNAPCEWKGKANCGGGDFPILGCPSMGKGVQQARHHGPEKNVQNNEPGNVHRICHYLLPLSLARR